MSTYYSKKKRKSISLFMIFLLISSLLLPNIVGAEIPNESNRLTVEQEKQLEKEREKSVLNNTEETNGEVSKNGIPSLLDGINLSSEPEYDEDDFVMEGKVETDIINELDSEGTVNVIIRLKESVDMKELSTTVSALDNKTDRVGTVIDELKGVAKVSQSKLLQQMQDLESKKMVSNIQSFWVINGLSATMNKEALETIAQREDVKRITLDREFQVPEVLMEDSPPRLPEWGLEKIFAPKVWGEYKLQGEGVVVGIMDTGVEGEHEALQHNYRGRDGNHQYSWIDLSGSEYSSPKDGHGHGTHVAGSAVGGGAGEPIGVAPGAEWIAAKIFNDSGGTTASAIHQAFEWFLAPGGDPSKAPDVVNNSWGSADTYRTEFLEGVRAWVAAGIFPLFSAGNEGPGAQTIGSPGSFPEAFAIGASDINDQIASFSSRGPVSWPNENGEQVRYIKPEVTAPGHQIYSAWPGGGYNTISGTSMAAPHVTGAIALILQSQPDLTIDEVADLLERTARTESHMGTLPNDNFGHGIVNVYQAVTEAAYAGEIRGTLKDKDGNPIAGEIFMPEEDLRIKVKEDGQFSFKVREGTHEVEVDSFGFHAITETVEVKKGEVLDKAWALEKAERFNVEGTVKNTDGEPVPYAYVRVLDTPLETVRTNSEGKFLIESVPENEYTIVVNGQGIKQKSETITVNENTTVNFEVASTKITALDDWATSKNNFSRNAVTSAEVDAEKLVPSWFYESSGQVLFSSPVIAEGKVVFTTDRGYVEVVDQRTGEELWSIRTGNTNRSTPTVVDGIVYVAGGSDSKIYAIDLESGMTKWTAKVDFPAIYEAPIYHDGILYITSYMEADAKTVALDAETGEKVWEKAIGDGSFFGGAIGEGLLYVGTYESKDLTALSLADGSEQWKVTLEKEGFASSPVYVDGVVYAVSVNFNNQSGTLNAFDAATGNKLWSAADIGDTQAGAPIVYDDLVIIGSSVKPVIKAFNKTSGELVWETDIGSMTVNSGAVSGNGYLFVTDLSSNLQVLDVFSGEKVHTYNLKNTSTAGVAITDGQIVVADHTGVSSFEAPGLLSGSVTNADGEGVPAKITIVGTGKSTEADENGNYAINMQPGTYDVKVAYYGLKQIVEKVTFVTGYDIQKDFKLDPAALGSFSGDIKDKRSGLPLEGVSIKVNDTPLEASSDKDGKYSFSEVYEGTYDVQFSLAGYVEQVIQVTVKGGENTAVPFEMTPVDVVVLDDYNGEIVRFLNNNNIPAEERGWDVIDEIGSYQILYMNGAYTTSGERPTEEAFEELVSAAEEKGVSIVFADTWGMSYGSLRHLWEFRNDPAQYNSDYESATIRLRVDEEHPIMAGLEKDSNYDIHSNGDFAWFNQYSGRHLATVGSTRIGFVGSGVAYKGVTEDSAHLLLSTHAASPWVSPFNGWLPTQQQILLNGINYVMDAEFGGISGSVVDTEGNPLEVTVEVVETGVSTKSTDGTFELFHDEGTYTVEFRRSGYAMQEATVEFKNGEPVIKDVTMGVSNSGTVSGQVTNKITGQAIPYVEINLYDEENNLVAEEVSSINGAYEITGLNEAAYTLKIVLRDHVTYTQTISVAGEPIQLDIEIYPSPEVGIIGDGSFGSLRDLLAEDGIEATNYSSISNILSELPNLDVVFFNDQSTSSVTLEVLEGFLAEADKHEVSVIFGDNYWSGSGLNHLVNRFKDPESRTQHRDYNSSAGYEVIEENPIFGDLKPGDFVDILLPNRSDVASFEGYSGYPLAYIKHEAHEDVHGLGIGYKPRTASSMELLMGGHGISFTHDNRHYTENGKDIFVKALLWAAYVEYNAIEGYVTDEEGNPVYANVKVKGEGLGSWTDPETGFFSIAALDGTYELEIESFGYQTQIKSVTLDENLEQFTVEMASQENNGSLEGKFFDENTLEGIQGVHIEVEGLPREATTNVSGTFTIEHLEPGTYSLVVKKEGYVLQEFDVEIKAKEATVFERKMKPSPTIGVIVDGQISSVIDLKEYLTPRGYIVEDLYYTDLDKIADYDLIFANSDYNNNLNPEKQVFLDFLKELDRTETPVIWTGNGGPRGSIRFLVDYLGDPAIEHMGSTPSSQKASTVKVIEDHPLLDGVKTDENGQFEFESRYYHGFEGYTGKTVATVSHPGQGELGSFVAYGGRTMNSVEVLLSNMTFGYGFTENGDPDENRGRIVNNALTWALDNKEPLVGEIHGQVNNNFDRSVFSTVTVQETGYTFQTEQDGSFFLALDTGTYTLNVDAFGHESETFVVDVVRGESKEQTFVLTSDNAGLIKGQVKAEDTNSGLEGAKIQLDGTPLQTTTDKDGYYELQAPAGEYQVRVTANGYTPQVVPVQVEIDQEKTLNFTLSISEKIAVVGTSLNAGRFVTVLEQQGYEAIPWVNTETDQLMEELSEYALVIFNDRHYSGMPEAKFKEFVDLADSFGISMIFTSQFSSGTIRDLRDFYQDPVTVTQGFSPGHVNYTVLQEHPIFAGYEVGDVIRILDRGDANQQWSYFSEYSGTTIADLTHDTNGTIGGGVAYKFRTANNVHILLSSIHAGAYGNPETLWTDDTTRIFTNAVDWAIAASLGEITGTVKDKEGNPIPGATVSIESQGLSTETNGEGQYRLGVGVGSHEVKVQIPGFVPQTGTAVIEELGQAVELNFEMEKTDRMSVTGKVTDTEGNGLEGAKVTLTEKTGLYEETVETNEAGAYQFDELLAGEYEIKIEVNGYQTVTQEIVIEDGENVELNIKLSDFNIAVLGDIQTSITDFLEESGLAAQKREWDIVDDVYNYEVIIVNTNTGTEEQLQKLIDESNKNETSLVFVDTWGVDGSIQLLEKAFGSPVRAEHGYNEGAVYVDVQKDHEIFTGLDEEKIKIHSEKSPYATFENYEGITLANLIVDEEDKGATIAYDFQSKNHMHLLLSTYAVNNMISPKQGWTEQGKQLYLQAIEWARDGVQELPAAPVADEEEIISTDGKVTLTGTGEYRSTVAILHGEEVLATVLPEKDGSFSVEIQDLEDGSYELVLKANNFAGEVTADKKVTVIVDTEGPQLEVTSPVDNMVTGKEVVDVNGTATDANLGRILVNGEEVAVDENGAFSTRIVLEEGTHTVKVEALDSVGNVTTVERTVTVNLSSPVITELTPSSDLYVKPGDKVEVSFRSESEGGTASYSIKLPAQITTQSSSSNEMEEVEPGVYKGTWTVPTNVDLQGAIIEVELTDVAGNKVVQEAAGKLFISQEQLERISGPTRYQTAVETSRNGWTTSDTVVLARGDDYADALAGVPLAHKLGAPILLTRSDQLPGETMEEITRLSAGRVIILGGGSAVSHDISSQLENEGLEVTRIAGSDRYHTAALISEQVAPNGADTVVIANGKNFPDALSVASFAAREGLPILLTSAESLSGYTKDAIDALGASESIVVGGYAMIPEEIADQLPSASRLRGRDRYETNIEVAKAFGVSSKHMYVATGKGFADALTGAVLASKNNSSILLVGDDVPGVVSSYMTEQGVKQVTIFGGQSAVSAAIAASLEKIIE
ncbi:subtilisin family serine protease/outer membrane protein assembly factor BamB/putative cell wall-binding protein [Bacillus tianshenii]|uniref:Subtilisin family serine protease/outer membrane protein assembly factor BamB/putative cell wall-binding protein n=1 Tax=Sutcliffiella tianshenii TaxID=1463404 RepID=A0ABS2NUA1_9BACI|nr:carboxypeptidase regulatory-like domain-containing protein [Bacillus tianshenii]MBM7618235.1 subtilisin family serine protease/outer membrane protein assembly factor BamB/putative cell wall-binding protein [Bacillus tianshenii]